MQLLGIEPLSSGRPARALNYCSSPRCFEFQAHTTTLGFFFLNMSSENWTQVFTCVAKTTNWANSSDHGNIQKVFILFLASCVRSCKCIGTLRASDKVRQEDGWWKWALRKSSQESGVSRPRRRGLSEVQVRSASTGPASGPRVLLRSSVRVYSL